MRWTRRGVDEEEAANDSKSSSTTKVYSNKCKWCGVTVDSREPLEVCECCGSTDIKSTSYFIEGDLPKTHKELKQLEAEEKAKAKKRLILAITGVVGALAAATATALLILL